MSSDNKKFAAISLDLESDHAGRIPESFEGWEISKISRLFKLLEKYQVVLNIFVVGNTLEKNRRIIKFIFNKKVKFYLHSFSHNLSDPDSKIEIRKGIKEFHKFFKKRPVGYRAPEGRISREGIIALKQNGFLFDSSVFPSFFPNLRYFFYPRNIYSPIEKFTEIPITTIGKLRMIFSLSWVKLFGWRIYHFLITKYRLPNNVLFNFHLHDLYMLSCTKKLPLFWKIVYMRNRSKGIKYLEKTLKFLRDNNYKFVDLNTFLNTT